MKKIRLIALALVLILLLTGCKELLAQARENARDKLLPGESEAPDTFASFAYVRPDMETLEALLGDCREAVEQGYSYRVLNEKIDGFYMELDNYDTMMSLANIRYAQDLTDTYYRDEYDYCVSQMSDVQRLLEDLFVTLAKSEYVDKLEADSFGEGFFYMYTAPAGSGDDWEYESIWDETYTSLYEREGQLANEYYARQEALSDLTFETDGDYAKALEQLGPLYVELITVRQEMADYLGYDSYEELAGEYYNRTYTPAQTEAYLASIREHLVPIYKEVDRSKLWDRVYETRSSEKMCMEYVSSAARAMGGSVERAYDLLERKELCDIAPGASKAAGSFEIYLPTFGVPFILMNPTGYLDDLLGFAHEFGHFANDFAAEGTYASADINEIFSQGMGYLALCYADSPDDDTLELLKDYTMASSLCTYVEQAAYYSFEQQAYRLTGEELTTENLCDLFGQTLQDFGLDSSQWDGREWTLIPHFYQQPFYVFSYVASNDGAMQLYQMELEGPGSGLALYSRMLRDWEDVPLTDYLSQYELQDPLAPGRVEELAGLFRDRLGDSLS